jgi:hypothetical protein
MEEKARMIGLEVNESKTKYVIMSALESRRKPQGLKIEGKIFTGVKSFNYLGNAINNGNRNDNYIKKKKKVENTTYFANLSTPKSKIISTAAKIQVYKTSMRPVATYGAETWTLTEVEENALRMFERKIIQRIYGPVMENTIQNIRYNEEINTLLKEMI